VPVNSYVVMANMQQGREGSCSPTRVVKEAADEQTQGFLNRWSGVEKTLRRWMHACLCLGRLSMLKSYYMSYYMSY
jgi:hypothetical protein